MTIEGRRVYIEWPWEIAPVLASALPLSRSLYLLKQSPSSLLRYYRLFSPYGRLIMGIVPTDYRLG